MPRLFPHILAVLDQLLIFQTSVIAELTTLQYDLPDRPHTHFHGLRLLTSSGAFYLNSYLRYNRELLHFCPHGMAVCVCACVSMSTQVTVHERLHACLPLLREHLQEPLLVILAFLVVAHAVPAMEIAQ